MVRVKKSKVVPIVAEYLLQQTLLIIGWTYYYEKDCFFSYGGAFPLRGMHQ